jgi:hypothetical protein
LRDALDRELLAYGAANSDECRKETTTPAVNRRRSADSRFLVDQEGSDADRRRNFSPNYRIPLRQPFDRSAFLAWETAQSHQWELVGGTIRLRGGGSVNFERKVVGLI